ncbi:MAG: hypothetical protein ABWW69_05705 [Pyrodictiaceae archaeon]
MSREIGQEKLRELKNILMKEIEEMEKRIEMYNMLLGLIDKCLKVSGEQPLEEAKRIEYVDKDENTIAVVYLGKRSFRLFFSKPFPQSNPYIKYILHVVEQLEGENENITHSIMGDNENINGIIVNGVSGEEIEEIQAALEYIMKKLAAKPKQSMKEA